MKLTITIEGISEDFADEVKRDVENAINYGYNGDMPSPDMSCTSEADDKWHQIAECCVCHIKHFIQDLNERGVCDGCAEG